MADIVQEPRGTSLPFKHGDRLDQQTFHALYETTPPGFRAELIGGIVHAPSPLKRPHGRHHVLASGWLWEYERATPGTETFDNTTTILGQESEPQPDLCLLITAPGHGQTRDENDYIVGPPELIVEISVSSEAVDLEAKKRDYEQEGVREYIVVAPRQARVYWFVRQQDRFEELAAGADGLLRSQVFPGLWLDPAALLRKDNDRLVEVLGQGLKTSDHAAFVAKLAGK